MRFYNREKELEWLTAVEEKSGKNAQMTIMVGRRRIGKTRLLKEFSNNKRFIYLFVARKNENLLCQEFETIIKERMEVDIFGTMPNFKAIFGYLMDFSQRIPFTLIIDEFQEFLHVNPSVFSEMQHIWDQKKETSKINLILCGSVYSMMTKIFEHNKEPLFGRATARIDIQPFNIYTLQKILHEHAPDFTKDDLLTFYIATGGVAKYVELLLQAGAFSTEKIIGEIVKANSIFLEEGKNSLIDEFGRDYGNYFSILTLLASSKTTRAEIESVLNMETGGFLKRLKTDFGIIEKVKPINSKPGSRKVRYFIRDNFLNFWFRFIYKHRSTLEIGNYQYVHTIINRDFNTFSGRFLERYFAEKIAAEGDWSKIGTYWESGNKNEIDIVAINQQERRILLCEVKRNTHKINLNVLKNKSQNLLKEFNNYHVQFRGLSLQDM